jgi:3-dehydroquinate dehydratase-2
MRQILLLNGPNLNLLGKREPEIYGQTSLNDVIKRLEKQAAAADPPATLLAFQSNHEGDLIDAIQCHAPASDAIIINPGALGHYSIALRDAISGCNRPVVEAHISNIHQRESFRHHSVISPVTVGQIVGLGIDVYRLALDYCLNLDARGRKA